MDKKRATIVLGAAAAMLAGAFFARKLRQMQAEHELNEQIETEEMMQEFDEYVTSTGQKRRKPRVSNGSSRPSRAM